MQAPQPSAKPTDASIKEIAKTDTDLAHAQLFTLYHAQITWHIANILHNWQEAEDLTVEVFLRAMEEDRIFNTKFRMRPWLYRVASNLSFNNLRDSKRRRVLLKDKGDRLKPDQGSLEELVFTTERAEWLKPYFGRLTINHQEVLRLRYWDDLTYKEIQQRLGIKLGTVMSRLSRARRELFGIFEEEEEEVDFLNSPTEITPDHL